MRVKRGLVGTYLFMISQAGSSDNSSPIYSVRVWRLMPVKLHNSHYYRRPRKSRVSFRTQTTLLCVVLYNYYYYNIAKCVCVCYNDNDRRFEAWFFVKICTI